MTEKTGFRTNETTALTVIALAAAAIALAVAALAFLVAYPAYAAEPLKADDIVASHDLATGAAQLDVPLPKGLHAAAK